MRYRHLAFFLFLSVWFIFTKCTETPIGRASKKKASKDLAPVVIKTPGNTLKKSTIASVGNSIRSLSYQMSRFSKKNLNGAVGGMDNCNGTDINFMGSDGETEVSAILDKSCVFDFQEVKNKGGNLSVQQFGYAPVYKKVEALPFKEVAKGSLTIAAKEADLVTEFMEIKEDQTFVTDSGYIVIVKPNSLLYADGSIVEKKVRFAITSILSSSDISYLPPMDAEVMGIDGNTIQGKLTSQAMMYIQVEDEDGAAIRDVDPSLPLTIAYPIQTEQESFANDLPSIPYWYFNHESFVWQNLMDPDGELVSFSVGPMPGRCGLYYISTKVTRIY